MRNWGESTKQEIFNHVSYHLIKQGAKAVWEGRCVCYDKNTGNRCAVGCLLPVEVYQRLGNMDIPAVYKMAGLYHSNILLSHLRDCHDHADVRQWKTRLRSIAYFFNLEIPPFFRTMSDA